MRVYGNQNVNMAVLRINQSQSARQSKRENTAGISRLDNRDKVTISLFGQPGGFLKSLMSQKQSLMEQKNQLLTSALENGKSRESIQSTLDSYEEQIKTIDQQIAQEMSRQNEKQVEKARSDKWSSTPKTKQEIENKRLSDITNLSSDLSQAENLHSLQKSIEGKANVLESEIELDKGLDRGQEASAGSILGKEARLADLRRKADQLMNKSMEKAAGTIEKAAESEEQTEEAAKKAEETDEKDERAENGLTEEASGKDADDAGQYSGV